MAETGAAGNSIRDLKSDDSNLIVSMTLSFFYVASVQRTVLV